VSQIQSVVPGDQCVAIKYPLRIDAKPEPPAEPWSMRVDLRDVHSLEHDTEFLRVLTDMIDPWPSAVQAVSGCRTGGKL
jgi:hypothetical protein